MPGGPGIISEELIAGIAAATRGRAETFLLTSAQEASAIIAQHGRCATSAIQICDTLPLAELQRLRTALPSVNLVQVIHVQGAASLAEALAAAPLVNTLLLDSGNPGLPTKELGGTGRVHDWDVSAEIVRAAGVPVYLAGGLDPGNVAVAIEAVRPFGVDVCSGVRSAGRLDERQLKAFIKAVAAA